MSDKKNLFDHRGFWGFAIAVGVVGFIIVASLAEKQENEVREAKSNKGFSTSVRLPETVILPACSSANDSWTKPVTTTSRASKKGFSWSWPVKAQLSIEGTWIDHVPNTSPDSDAARFCADKIEHVGKAMPIIWK